MTKYCRPSDSERRSAGTNCLWLRTCSRNPVDSALDLCSISKRDEVLGVCRFSFHFVRNVSGFSALEIRDVLNCGRRFLKNACLRHDVFAALRFIKFG